MQPNLEYPGTSGKAFEHTEPRGEVSVKGSTETPSGTTSSGGTAAHCTFFQRRSCSGFGAVGKGAFPASSGPEAELDPTLPEVEVHSLLFAVSLSNFLFSASVQSPL